MVISASHIPIGTTGSNSSNEGFKLPDEVEARIEQLIVSEIKHLRPTADAIEKPIASGDAEGGISNSSNVLFHGISTFKGSSWWWIAPTRR